MSITNIDISTIDYYNKGRLVRMSKVTISLNLKPHLERMGRKQGKKSSLTQSELETATGIPQGTISRWVNDKVDSYDRKILQLLMQYFDCSLEDLFTIEVAE